MNRFSFGLLLLICISSTNCVQFQVIKQWKSINFTWASREAYEMALSTQKYQPENTLISGIKFHDKYFYLTLPRLRQGVPVTLARIARNSPASPLLEPYPSWEMQQQQVPTGNCTENTLVSVSNVEIDSSARMWIIDSGLMLQCSPKLVIWDMKRNESVLNYVFPDDVISGNETFLHDLVVDETESGDFAYITANSRINSAIVVFSLKEKKSWKVQAAPFEQNAQFSVNGRQVADIAMAAIALSPKIRKNAQNQVEVTDEKTLYYCPLASQELYAINTSVLHNEMQTKDAIKPIGVKQGQTSTMVMDNRGSLYYSVLNLNAIAKWNTQLPLEKGQRLIAQDENYLEWVSGLTFDNAGNMSALVNRFNRFMSSHEPLNLKEYNFRIVTAKLGVGSYLDSADDFHYETKAESTPRNGKALNGTAKSGGERIFSSGIAFFLVVFLPSFF